MPALTKRDIEAITRLLDSRIHPLAEDVKAIRETVDSHTTTLDTIVKNTEHWKTEAAAIKSELDRHDRWIKEIAQKLRIKLSEEE